MSMLRSALWIMWMNKLILFAFLNRVVWQVTKGNQRMGEIQSGKKTKESNKAIHHHPKCEAKCGLTVTKIKKYKEKN